MKQYFYLLSTIACIFFSLQPNAQTTIYVDSTASGGNNGISWSNAYNKLTPALAEANNMQGTVFIKIAKGTYYPAEKTGSNPAHRDSSFRILRDSIQLFGGYANGGGRRQNFNEFRVILSGDIGIQNDTSDNCRQVMVLGNSSPVKNINLTETIINGLTFTAGNSSADGGGLLISYGNISLFTTLYLGITISDCTFIENYAKANGAAVSMYFNSPQNARPRITILFLNCIFKTNKAQYGGAIACYSSGCAPSIKADGCSYIGNSARASGGAVFTTGEYYTNPVFNYKNSSFFNNDAINDGGAVYASIFSGTHYNYFTKCSFDRNKTGSNGGAVCVAAEEGTTQLNMEKCNLTNNTASFGGAVSNLTRSYESYIKYTACVFDNNDSKYKGGAIYNFCKSYNVSYPEMINCLLVNNQSKGNGGAIYNEGESNAKLQSKITSSTFYNNRARSRIGATLYNEAASIVNYDTTHLYNSIIWESTGYEDRDSFAIMQTNAVCVLYNSLLQGKRADGTFLNGNSTELLNTNPNFADKNNLIGIDGEWATKDDGLRLREISGAVGEGKNNFVEGIETDITGKQRIQCEKTDLGAYERKCTDEGEGISMNKNVIQPQNEFSIYPNPVQNELHVFAGDYTGKIAVTITDAGGKTYKHFSGYAYNGIVQNLSVSSLKPGVYMLTASYSDQMITRKIVKQ